MSAPANNKKNQIQKQLDIWDNRVFFNGAFKKNTKANLEFLDKIYNKSMTQFTIIAANSEACVYKIARYFISNHNVMNNSFTFIDGRIVESYIGDKTEAGWKRKDRINEFMNTFGEQFKNKWVIIPLMQFPIDIASAVYFTTSFKQYKALGLIFSSVGVDHLAETLCYGSDMKIYEFPETKYRRTRFITDDEW